MHSCLEMRMCIFFKYMSTMFMVQECWFLGNIYTVTEGIARF